MSKLEKLITKLKQKTLNLSYDDMSTLLSGLGYREDSKGKTSGSRVRFINEITQHSVLLHKPHGRKGFLKYQIEEVLNALLNAGVIK